MSVPRAVVCLLSLVCCLLSLLVVAGSALASETGLIQIPTTDVLRIRTGVVEAENGNTSFNTPAFYSAPHFEFDSEFGVARRVEAGVDWNPTSDGAGSNFAFNLKARVLKEDYWRPNIALGIDQLGVRRTAGYYITFSKTINYAQVMDRQKGIQTGHIHHHTIDVLPRRIHVGLLHTGRDAVRPFVGLDIEASPHLLIQSDWVSGAGYAITLGAEYTFPDEKTAVAPAILFSNDKHRLDGFMLNISRQIDF